MIKFNKASVNSIICAIITSIIIFIFLYSALDKMVNLEKFMFSLSQSLFIPENLKTFIGWMTIIAELGIVVLFFFKKTKSLALLFSFGLFLLFTGYIFLIMNYSPYLPCSCGGFIEELDWKEHLILNIVLTTMAAYTFICEKYYP